MTNKEAVSQYINSLRLLNSDEHISRRYVLHLLKNISKTLIAQKLQERTITKDLKLYSLIECFEFERIQAIKCPMVEFRRCDILMKSKKPLPETIFSRLGVSIRDITSVDDSFGFTIVDKKQYRINKDRRYSIKNNIYIYLGVDGHLYIPEKTIKTINLEILTLETQLLDGVSACCEGCKSGWDAEFIFPDKLTTTIFDKVTQELAGVYKNIVPDQRPNDVERQ